MAIPIRQVRREVLLRPAGQAVLGGIAVGFVAAIIGWEWLCLAGLVVSAGGGRARASRGTVRARALQPPPMGVTARLPGRTPAPGAPVGPWLV